MADKLPDNIRAGLDAELTGLQARLDAGGGDIPAETREMLERRIGEVNDQLGAKRSRSTKERRPSGGGAEKRPAG